MTCLIGRPCDYGIVDVFGIDGDPPASLADSLDVLEADRIAYGVAAIRDPALLGRLVRDQIPLDVCPSSNVGTGLLSSRWAHQSFHSGGLA